MSHSIGVSFLRNGEKKYQKMKERGKKKKKKTKQNKKTDLH